VEIDPVHRRDSSHGLRQRYGARKLRAAFTSAGSSRARSRLRLQARGFCHEVRVDSIRPCRWASGLVGPDVYRPDNIARRAAPRFDDLRNQSPWANPLPVRPLFCCAEFNRLPCITGIYSFQRWEHRERKSPWTVQKRTKTPGGQNSKREL
jgi:hypothetical protein